jgi:hypothetical protein
MLSVSGLGNRIAFQYGLERACRVQFGKEILEEKA